MKLNKFETMIVSRLNSDKREIIIINALTQNTKQYSHTIKFQDNLITEIA